MTSSSLAGLSIDLEIVILRIEVMIMRRHGRRRRRESRSLVPILHYICGVLENVRRMLRHGGRYDGGGGVPGGPVGDPGGVS